MIYCVVPEELAPELYDKLADYYADDPNVEVIIDRREGERRTEGDEPGKGILQTCSEISQAAVNEFREKYQGRSPEPITPRFNG